MPTPLIFLRSRIRWFGAHSGYDCLIDKIASADPAREITVLRPDSGVPSRLLGKLISKVKGYGARPQGLVATMYRMARRMQQQPTAVGHIVHGEEALPYLDLFAKDALNRLVVTIHQPRALWTAEMELGLRKLRNVLVLYSQDREYLSSLAAKPATVLLHGVDTDFFRPNPLVPPSRPSLLFSGVHLRSTEMLKNVVDIVRARGRDPVLNFLVPADHPVKRELERKFCDNSVAWLSGLDDHQLLALYQSSTAMLLPLTDSGANTAVIEALACGLPLATTRVGGIADYGGDTIFPTVELNDCEGMADLVCQYLENPQFLRETSAKMRRFAESRLTWNQSVAEHLKYYESVM